MVGVDVGGSHIAAGLFDGREFIRRHHVAFAPGSVREDVVEAVAEASSRVTPRQSRLPVGVGMPGVTSADGVVLLAPNLSLWDFPMQARLRDLGLSAHVINDANAAALAEWHSGAGRGARSLICVTVGTGVGAGIVLDGQVLFGACGRGGEIGHMLVMPGGPECGCGTHGCLEALASGQAIARMGRQACSGGDPVLLRLCSDDPRTLDAKMVFEAARAGSRAASQIVEQAAMWLGIALANVVSVVDPEVIIVGGGVALSGEEFLDAVSRSMEASALCRIRMPAVVRAHHGTDAGLLGAAVFAGLSSGVLRGKED
ncbi:MAG: ROK family protein [Bacillota bacterium]|nr:ROK family protein [Bacillota bacterium]